MLSATGSKAEDLQPHQTLWQPGSPGWPARSEPGPRICKGSIDRRLGQRLSRGGQPIPGSRIATQNRSGGPIGGEI